MYKCEICFRNLELGEVGKCAACRHAHEIGETDQYGYDIPYLTELSYLYKFAHEMSEDELESIVQAQWYEGAGGQLYVKDSDIPGWLRQMNNPEYVAPILAIPLILNRFNIIDGFYHA